MFTESLSEQEQDDLVRTSFGKALSEQRIASGFSQRSFARLVGISNSHLRKIETGQTSPTLVTLYKIANVLQVSPETLLSRANATLLDDRSSSSGY